MIPKSLIAQLTNLELLSDHDVSVSGEHGQVAGLVGVVSDYFATFCYQNTRGYHKLGRNSERVIEIN